MGPNHWHVADHYTGEARDYTDRRLMQQWVRRHGGEPIVEVEACNDVRCLATAPGAAAAGDGE